MDAILNGFIESLSKSKKALDAAKKRNREAKRDILSAKAIKNNELIKSSRENLEAISKKPSLCKEDVKKYHENYKNVCKTEKKNMAAISYARQELKDAKLRYKNAKKEVREAKKFCRYALHAGDSDQILKKQEEINDIKLEITKENLACERVICDAKAYIKSQELIIKDNKLLSKTNDESAIEAIRASKEKIKDAKRVLAKAKSVLPITYMLHKFYLEHIQAFEAFVLLLPAGLILLVFMIYPLINTTIMSFMEDFSFVGGNGIMVFQQNYSGIGFGDYLTVITDEDFLHALGNTAIMVIVSVPLTVIIALLISVSLNGIKKFQSTYQTIFFLPYVTNTIALGMVFNVMFKQDGGLINTLFHCNIAWIEDFTTKGYWTSLVVLTTYTVWNGLAFKILIFLSGLQSIDKQYYDAALIDGASKNRIFRKITVPLLSPIILYTVVTSFIGAFKAYSNVIAIFGRGNDKFGPLNNDNMWITVVGYIYNQLHSSGGIVIDGVLSKASAGAVILLLIILLITILQLVVSKKKVHY